VTRSPKEDADQGGGDDAPIVLEQLSIDLDDLRRRGPGPYRLQADLPTAWAAEVLRETDAEAGAAGQADLELAIQGDGTVLLRGAISLVFSVPCARCLAPAVVDAGGELCLTAVPAARLRREIEAASRASADPEGLEIGSEDLDQVGYEGHRIDLGQILGEQALLAYPIRALCGAGEACEGLCSVCGANVADVRAGRTHCDTCGGDPERAKSASGHEANDAWKDALRKLTRS
jgi:uncharacterized metal-binding protein YceD (DUF177 family)